MIYGYARESTKGQEKYGNSLVDQHKRLIEAGATQIYSKSFTGTKMERPEFTKLLSVLKEGDTLIVTKLDRFARTATDGARTVQALVNRGKEGEADENQTDAISCDAGHCTDRISVCIR